MATFIPCLNFLAECVLEVYVVFTWYAIAGVLLSLLLIFLDTPAVKVDRHLCKMRDTHIASFVLVECVFSKTSARVS